MRRLSQFAIFGLLAAAPAAHADPISTWSGASASVRVFDQSQTQLGASASASAAEVTDVPYVNANYHTDYAHPFHVNINGSADAQASGQASNLLRLDAGFMSGNPGSNPRPVSADYTSYPVAAEADWSGDRIRVTPASGATMPQSVRLNFAVAFVSSQTALFYEAAETRPEVKIAANGQSVTIDSYNGRYDFQPPEQSTTAGTLLLYNATSQSDSAQGSISYRATFHVDLPISAAGLSDPFSLGLSASTGWGLTSNNDTVTKIQDLSLSLTGVTLLDGTPLSSLGDSVTFASGLAFNTPEPSTLAIAAAGMIGLAARRWRGGRAKAD